jgi:pyruvate dehydrogenase complex dehydrogenase (E1) component
MEIDGHNMGAILQALDEAEQLKGRPAVIVAKTIKGARSPFGTFRTDPRDIIKAAHQAMKHKTS